MYTLNFQFDEWYILHYKQPKEGGKKPPTQWPSSKIQMSIGLHLLWVQIHRHFWIENHNRNSKTDYHKIHSNHCVCVCLRTISNRFHLNWKFNKIEIKLKSAFINHTQKFQSRFKNFSPLGIGKADFQFECFKI